MIIFILQDMSEVTAFQRHKTRVFIIVYLFRMIQIGLNLKNAAARPQNGLFCGSARRRGLTELSWGLPYRPFFNNMEAFQFYYTFLHSSRENTQRYFWNCLNILKGVRSDNRNLHFTSHIGLPFLSISSTCLQTFLFLWHYDLLFTVS